MYIEQKEVTIPVERYRELIADSQKLAALENAGVDNWEGYSSALMGWINEKDETYEDIYGTSSDN